jgi:predicted O-linked N-acetylglucosamine transferase (SPINDLY family)
MKRRKLSIPSPQRKPTPVPPNLRNAQDASKPDLARAIALHQQGKLDEAASIYERILQNQPNHFDALQMRGAVAAQRSNFGEAVTFFDQALAINPMLALALTNRGTALRSLRRIDEALASFERALEINPNDAVTHYNKGSALSDVKDHLQALASYDKALKLRPDYFVALNNRGNALLALLRFDEAIESYRAALRIKPDAADVLCNCANALREMNRFDEAMASYDSALKIDPAFAVALNNRGNCLAYLKRHEEALRNYDRALTLQPTYAEALVNRANTLREMKRHEDALASYESAVKLKPEYELLWANRLFARLKLCDWRDLDEQIAILADKIECDKNASPPFPFLSISNSPAQQKSVAMKWIATRHPINPLLPQINKYARHQKIRIGYFSADFRNHPGSFLMAGLFESHDRSRFELTAFSFGPPTQDEMQQRVAAAFDSFIDVRDLSDKDVALLARRLEIDIAIDRKGFTQGARPGIFALRAAPIQVAYLAYPGTMGADYIDYIVADHVVIPQEDQPHYAEKVAYLPNSYQVNDSKRRIAERKFGREELGLPDVGFVFCCFNNNYKIMPATFDRWMRILQRVEGSVLWLFEDNATATSNLRKEAEKRGVSGNRLVVAQRMDLAEHLARHRNADLFLDCLPYNAHTTASDALWAGLPVVTCIGETFAARVAASLLKAIDLPELITTTPEDFEELAVTLATHPDKLAAIRQKLSANRMTTSLFDTELFTRHLETLYTKMFERHQAGLAPDHIDVT